MKKDHVVKFAVAMFVSCAVPSICVGQPLDSFNVSQTAVSTKLKLPDSKSVLNTDPKGAWSNRRLEANILSVCGGSKDSSAGIAGTGNGTLYVTSINSRGHSSISWTLSDSLGDKKLAIYGSSFSIFDASGVTRSAPSTFSLSASISTRSKILVKARRTIVFSPRGSQPITVDFKKLFPNFPSAFLKSANRVALEIKNIDTCSSKIGIRPVEPPQPRRSFAAPHDLRQNQMGATGADNNSASSASGLRCDDPSVDDQISECERNNSTTCKHVMCECSNIYGGGVLIDPSQVTFSKKGMACSIDSGICQGSTGECDGQGACGPKGDISSKIPFEGFVTDCMNDLPGEPPGVCEWTWEQILQYILSFAKPAGTQCEVDWGIGSCDGKGVCVVAPPPPEAVADCAGQYNCTPCGSNGACWEFKCLTPTEFESANCKGVATGQCRVCVGLPSCYPSGTYFLEAAHEGEPCKLSSNQTGVCKGGFCLPPPQTSSKSSGNVSK